ncbi:MAG: Na/Pi cotransporter family protein [Nitrospirota bacterium]|nr:Na/Pi cotransporter family protein [Nitrospirota bacterium]
MTSLMFLTLFGGVCLLLYGIRLAGSGLQQAAGARMRGILASLTSNRVVGMGVGAAVTALLQSSSATSVMLVGFAGSGLMNLSQAMGVVLGADIGTTLTVQLIAFQFYDYAIFLVGIGITLSYLGKKHLVKHIGESILGFALIFLSLKLMTDAMAPLKQDPVVEEIFLLLQGYPFMVMLAAAIFTALVHSSAATIGMALAFASQGLIGIQAAIPIIFGANIGTCATAIALSFGATTEAKRVAAAHTLFKVLGVCIFFPLIVPFTQLITMTADDPMRQIANGHTVFNIAIALLFLPFTGPLSRFIQRMIPETAPSEKFAPKYLNPQMLESTPLALGQAAREVLRMADIVGDMLKKSIEPLKRGDVSMVEELQDSDDKVDLLNTEIKLYLAKLSQASLTERQSKREMDLLTFTENLEHIGDVIDKNIMELAKKKIINNLAFSEQGLSEIVTFHGMVAENFDLAVSVFTTRDIELARKLVRHKARISELEREYRQAHINRLHKGFRESIETSSIHLDVLSNLQRINSLLTDVAYPVLEVVE